MSRRKVLARRGYYFSNDAFPLAVREIATHPNRRKSHTHDLTAVEHTHDFRELVIVTRGRGIHCLEGNDFPVAAGDVFLLHERQRHFFRQPDALELQNIMYDPEGLALPESRLRLLPGYCALFLLEPAYRRQHNFASRLHLTQPRLAHAESLAQEIAAELEGGTAGCEAAALTYFLELLVFLGRAYTGAPSTEAGALLRMGSVIGALERDSARAWTVAEILDIAHLSRSQLMRVFRKATGQTPIDYLIRLRLQRALPLLRQTDWSVTQVAAHAGFPDSNYFARQFRKLFGETPSAYRNRLGAT